MNKPETGDSAMQGGDVLLERVVAILEQARGNVVRSVNSSMVVAYWLIGQEIVQQVQDGEDRAEYGGKVIDGLSRQLTQRYGSGFSPRNLRHFRQFYAAFAGRLPIRNPPGSKSGEGGSGAFRNLPGSTSEDSGALALTRHAVGSGFAPVFAPELSWSHYRALMRVANADARGFYEREAVECGWSKAQLERQIQSSLYERILANRGREGLVSSQRERLPGEPVSPQEVLRSPLVLEFLDLPDRPELRENSLEQAIIDNLQSFLLELGKGFAFVERQKHICFDDDDFYIDLAFYNFILKCFLLIDLKIGKLTHRDVGQMDGYVRLYEDRFKVAGDNPTIGLILCSDKSEAVAKYSILSEGRRIFASKYLQFLPSEEELKLEIEKERRLLETGNGRRHGQDADE